MNAPVIWPPVPNYTGTWQIEYPGDPYRKHLESLERAIFSIASQNWETFTIAFPFETVTLKVDNYQFRKGG